MTEPSDIVARLRAHEKFSNQSHEPKSKRLMISERLEAATLIERQAAEIERLRGALLPFTCQGVDLDHVGSVYVAQSDVIAALAALSGKAAA